MSWVDDFVNKKTREGGFGGDRGSLKKWKTQEKRTSVIVWHHTDVGPQLFWSHQFPRKVVLKDKDTGDQTTHFWQRGHGCWEDESYLLQQYRWKDGVPKERPKVCPFCKLAVWLREQVEGGKISWLDPVFEFEDAKGNTELVAAGLYGYLNKKLETNELSELKKAGLSQRDAWKQSLMAKAQWAFSVVDNANPDDGVQVVVESNLLGEEMQTVFNDTMESLGVEEGDISKHPYAIEWISDPKATSFSDKYKARRIERVKLTPDIDELIRGPVPKDAIARALEKVDARLIQDLMETHCVMKGVPFDTFFKDVVNGEPKTAAATPKAKQGAKAEPKKEPAKAKNGRKPAPTPEPEPSGETLPCDKCGAAMALTDTQCKKCGQKYELDDVSEPKKASNDDEDISFGDE